MAVPWPIVVADHVIGSDSLFDLLLLNNVIVTLLFYN